MGTKTGAHNFDRFNPGLRKKIGSKGGKNLWKKIKQGKFPVNPMGRP